MLLRYVERVPKPVQICFIMKGVRLPVHFSFTPRLISATIKVCRRYRDGSSRLSSSVPASEADNSPPRATSRKSHSRHPRHRFYDTLGSPASYTATPTTTRDSIGVSTGSMLRSTLSGNAEDQCAGSARAFETPSDKLKEKRSKRGK
jgi:hypothetical protein